MKKKLIQIFTIQIFSIFLSLLLLYIIHYDLKDIVVKATSSAGCNNSNFNHCILSFGIIYYTLLSFLPIILVSLVNINYIIKVILIEFIFIFVQFEVMHSFAVEFIHNGIESDGISLFSGEEDIWILLFTLIIYLIFLGWYLKPNNGKEV